MPFEKNKPTFFYPYLILLDELTLIADNSILLRFPLTCRVVFTTCRQVNNSIVRLNSPSDTLTGAIVTTFQNIWKATHSDVNSVETDNEVRTIITTQNG